MRRSVAYVTIFFLLLLAPLGVRYARFHNLVGSNDVAAPPPVYAPEDVAQRVFVPPSSEYTDDPTLGSGYVLLDWAHGNDFTVEEMSYLDGRLSARGFQFLNYHGGDDLASALRPVTAFIVIAPQTEFRPQEVQAVADFVNRGGRVLMIGDPTRFTVDLIEDGFSFTFAIGKDDIPLNSLANQFDIIFNGDYLYNTSDNEGNFRNIILGRTGLAEHSLTDGLDKLAFYGSHSLHIGSSGVPLLTVDDNTRSSATDRPGGLSLGVLNANERVLALGDLNFLTAPHYTVYDNSQFIARIADFLTAGDERGFVLADFPFFFERPIDLIYTGTPDLGPDAFDEIIALQRAFRQLNQTLTLSAEPLAEHDTVYFGLYNEAEEVADLLASAEVSLLIDPPISVEDADDEEETAAEDEEIKLSRQIQSALGNVQMSGTALFLLDENDGRRQLVVLASSHEGLESAIERLLSLAALDAGATLSDCLLQDQLALCPTYIAGEVVEAKLETGGAPDAKGTDDSPGGPGDNGEPLPDLDADLQGSIGLDETVSGTLAEAQSHAWIFSDGPAVIDITLESGEDLDSVLELYDADGELIASADSGFSGERERLLNVDIPDDDDYTIVVRDFFEDGGEYELHVSLSAMGSSNSIFIYVDDDGTPISNGINSVESLVDLLGDDFELTVWSATVDGPLAIDSLDGYRAVIWDSGDYQDDVFGEDTTVLISYFVDGGNLFLTGSAPPLFEPIELASLVDLEVADSNTALLDGLEAGEVISLNQTYQTALLDEENADLDEEDIIVFLRGPGSAGSGNAIAIAYQDEFSTGAVFLLAVPLVAMPQQVQALLVENIVGWFGLR